MPLNPAVDGTGPAGKKFAGPRKSLHPRSWQLSTRLVAVMLALLTVICALVGFVSYTTLSLTINTQLDTSLQQATVRTIAFYTSPTPNGSQPDPLDARATSAGQLSAVLSNGVVHYAGILSSTGTRQQLTTSDADALASLPANGALSSASLSLGKYRLQAESAPNGDTLITGLPMTSTQQTLSALVLAIVLVSLAGLMALGWAGTTIIRRNLRPLEQLSDTATKVAVLRLDAGEVALSARVPDAVSHPGTEVGNVGNAFNAMLENVSNALEARQLSETKLRRFVADASHELRTPLTAIRGYAELLSMTEPLSADGQTALGRVQDQSVRMSRLVEDLLTLARLDEAQQTGHPAANGGVSANGTVKAVPNPVNMSPLVMEAVRDIQVATPDHRWSFTVPDEPVEALCDETALRQIIVNLLGNAAKHTPAGTAVHAALSQAPDGGCLMEVNDTGPGIDPAFQEIIFDRFSRADQARTCTAGSTGLGLSIVQAIVRSHGGSVAVASTPGHTVFSVYLPGTAAGACPGAELGADSSATPATQPGAAD
ncbi:HAMP domain-containing sensor histidine kinase [Arthrobacter sp. H35-D1]|uniref:sensor histidine kinase n=1 Tax=Arthrobacter sp. H35-D1 TaxID=3046202 RepID=UPI0024B8A8EE|nr:HAMP domain-containing sensor histidine kinase [Arthrobacter sp. H35-D1]MDJ0311686.1 HAMP domain-containing sensor histidine kinase [Arthrobacter sp. H35-D1]